MIFDSDSSEEDEEITTTTTTHDLPLQPFFTSGANNKEDITYESADYIEAKGAIAKNPFDKNSWIIMLSEVEKCGNKSTILDAFCEATIQFPRTASLWKRYIGFLIHFEEIQQAEDAFRKCLTKCRSVELWISYLDLIRSKTVGKYSPASDQYTNTKKIYESAFENALENVGSSIDVNVLWRKYIDFVLEWPESGRKLTVLRDLYQRAICSPMEALDNFWKEYEEWEMQAGKHLAEQLLPEFKRKYQDARNIYKERKKLYVSLDMTYIASPPSPEGSIVEVKQLELWNQLIKAELKNPHEYTIESQLRTLMDMIFDRFLSCFFLHPEAWMMFSKYQLQFYGTAEARNVLKEAILVIPKVPTLWLELAELEESCGDTDSALDILRLCFEQNPSPFTFSILQKFIRRKEGKFAARQLFSDTFVLREEGVLGLDTYVAHAALELRVNNEPEVALRVLEAARDHITTVYSSILYIQILTKVLVRLGDFRQIRWVYEANVGLLEENGAIPRKQPMKRKFKIEDELSLWEELLEAEITMGMSDTKRLMLLQEKVRSTKAECNKISNIVPSKIDLFEPIQQLYARYHDVAATLPESDAALKRRVLGALLKDTNDKGPKMDRSSEGHNRRRRKGEDGNQHEMELSGVPIFLRDLLLALPNSLEGPRPSTDAFIDQLRRTVLPPRPMSEKGNDPRDSSSALGLGGSHLLDLPVTSNPGNKRKIASVLNEDADSDREEPFNDGRHDVFRQRRRVKMDQSF